MLVLSLVVMTLLVGLFLQAMDGVAPVMFGDNDWRLVQLGVLLIVHCMAGIASWGAHYHQFGNRALWIVAVCLHPLVYTINWEIYAALVLTGDDTNLAQNLTTMGIIIIPSMLLFGGPFNALINPPPRYRSRREDS